MNDIAFRSGTQEIVVDEVFPHAPETIWKTLTNGTLMGRWLMAPTGFEPVRVIASPIRRPRPARGMVSSIARCWR